MAISAPTQELKKLVNSGKYILEDVNLNLLNEIGFSVFPKSFSQDFVEKWYGYFNQSNSFEPYPRHASRMTLSNPEIALDIVDNEFLVGLSANLFSGNAACDYPQIFRKNSEFKERVILHNDIMYMSGSQKRYSLFIALTPVCKSNGGLILYPGTHQLGLLGDAGELNRGALPHNFPTVCPDLQPGDAILMNSALWHESKENIDGTERVYLEIKLSDIDDPTAKIELCGKRKSQWRLPDDMSSIFVNSRIQRIMKLMEKCDQL
jgi:hypothetical protein